MAKVKLSFDEYRTNLLREVYNENGEEVDKIVKKIITSLDGVSSGVAVLALLFVILSCAKAYFGKPNVSNRFEAMDQIGYDLIQYIHNVLLKKF